LKEQIIASVAQSISHDEPADFLIKVAGEDADRELRKKATFWLGQLIVKKDFAGLSKTEDASILREKRIFHSIRQTSDEDAVPALIEIARTHPVPEMRKEAFRFLSEIGSKRVLEFFTEHLSR
jgi:hypothetical protein